jgi:phage terminase small subunit
MIGPDGAAGLTPKQEAFARIYLEIGNASEAYRRSYNAERMTARTIEKRASELLKDGAITGRIAEYQAKAADRAVLGRAWVLERLMRNARIAMGEENIKVKIRPKSAPDTVVELEITARDAGAANRALELLGKSDEVRLFIDRVEATGKDGAPLIADPSSRDIARAIADILRTARIEGSADDADETTSNEDDTDLHEQSAPDAIGGHAGAAARSEDAGAWGSQAPAAPRGSLQPGEREVLDSGASVFFDGQLLKYGIYGSDGQLCGFRREFKTAREFAASLKPPKKDQR